LLNSEDVNTSLAQSAGHSWSYKFDHEVARTGISGLKYKISSLFFESFCKCQNCYAMFWLFRGGCPQIPPWLRAWCKSIGKV